MATDIVERLRDTASYNAGWERGYKTAKQEAADEIERLRAERRPMDGMSLSLRSVANHERDHKGNIELAGIIDAAADEIERLRAVLQSLTKDPPAFLAREPDTDAEVIIKMRDIARAALGDQ